MHAAEIRKTVGMVSSMDTAIHTFEVKHSCLPGDCRSAVEQGLAPTGGFYVFQFVNIDAFGNGDGLINWDETFLVLPHLESANLVPMQYAIANDTYPADDLFNRHYLKTPMGDVYLQMRPDARNGIISGAPLDYALSALEDGAGIKPVGIRPIDALAIDTKIDDAQPLSGKAFASGVFSQGPGDVAASEGTASQTVCINNTVTPKQYNSAINGMACNMGIASALKFNP